MSYLISKEEYERLKKWFTYTFHTFEIVTGNHRVEVMFVDKGNIKVLYESGHEQDEDEEEDEEEWYDQITISYKYNGTYKPITWNKITSIQQGLSFLQKVFSKKYTYCECCKVELTDYKTDGYNEDCFKFCKTCYVNSCVREDECPVCQENGEKVWVVLECNHIMCLVCRHSLKEQKCPLCRKQFTCDSKIYPLPSEKDKNPTE